MRDDEVALLLVVQNVDHALGGVLQPHRVPEEVDLEIWDVLSLQGACLRFFFLNPEGTSESSNPRYLNGRNPRTM